MDDLISRQDVIDAISTWNKFGIDERNRVVRWYEGLEPYVKLRDVVWAIEKVPSAQRWIPCSERLPEENKMVLTTTIGTDIVIQHDDETFEEAFERSMKSPVKVSIGFIGSDGWYGVDWFPSIISPSAWMPLPEPYKEEEQCP